MYLYWLYSFSQIPDDVVVSGRYLMIPDFYL